MAKDKSYKSVMAGKPIMVSSIKEICEIRRGDWLNIIYNLLSDKEVEFLPGRIFYFNEKIYELPKETRRLDFRNMADSWYAYYSYSNLAGGKFLKSTLVPQWFNKGDLKQARFKETIYSDFFHFRSKEAQEILEEKNTHDYIVKDHIVPVKVLEKQLRLTKPNSTDAIETFLINNYRIGIISKKEHNMLDACKLRSSMPHNTEDTFSRYRVARIISHDGASY